jgi:hypothetical protein
MGGTCSASPEANTSRATSRRWNVTIRKLETGNEAVAFLNLIGARQRFATRFGAHTPILPEVATLLNRGPAERVWEELRAIQTVALINRDRTLWSDRERDRMKAQLDRLGAERLDEYRRLKITEERIRAAGYELDADGKALRECHGGRGRPGNLINRLYVEVYVNHFDGEKLTDRTLDAIIRRVSLIIPRKHLDVTKAYDAIKNRGVGAHNKKRKKSQSRKNTPRRKKTA